MPSWLSACLPACLSAVYTTVSLPACVCVNVFLPAYLSACLPVCLSLCMSVYLYVYMTFCLPVCLSIYLSVFLSFSLYICLSVCLSVWLAFFLSACLFFVLTFLKGHVYCFPKHTVKDLGAKLLRSTFYLDTFKKLEKSVMPSVVKLSVIILSVMAPLISSSTVRPSCSVRCSILLGGICLAGEKLKVIWAEFSTLG